MNEEQLKELMNGLLTQTKNIIETNKQELAPAYFVKKKNMALDICLLQNFTESAKPIVAQLMYEIGKDQDTEAIIILMRAETRQIPIGQVEDYQSGKLDRKTLPAKDIIHMAGETLTGIRTIATMDELPDFKLGEIQWFTEDARTNRGQFSHFFRDRSGVSDLDYIH